MKLSTKILFALAGAYALATTSTFAQVYTFDEYGNSTGPGISPGTLQPDPSGGLPVPVMVFNLAFPVITGDLVMGELGSLGAGPISDVVRFWDPTGGPNSQIIFYSDLDDAPPAPADTGVPGTPMSGYPDIFTPESGPDGNNGAVYTPLVNQPGYIPGAGATYNIISDVPEPGAMALMAIGGGLLLAAMKQRRQSRV
jgi:hypothetical protein